MWNTVLLVFPLYGKVAAIVLKKFSTLRCNCCRFPCDFLFHCCVIAYTAIRVSCNFHQRNNIVVIDSSYGKFDLFHDSKAKQKNMILFLQKIQSDTYINKAGKQRVDLAAQVRLTDPLRRKFKSPVISATHVTEPNYSRYITTVLFIYANIIQHH